jgi:hypothetical protein
MSSWADDVRAYEAAKRTTPGPTQRVQVASQKERLSKERDYNPLAGKYRDPERESSTRKAEQSRLDRQQAMTLTRAVKYDAPYNILNGVRVHLSVHPCVSRVCICLTTCIVY